ncbi:SgcJ/EcaC family oxidoreductase [Rubinisphaera brasiliensis]|uniref:SnoaL-like domain-containing protein n=1 Tax=Rubinisphaera brasiliensis (strain ATCC 49424 / DSM 5305 / JCM 21570 / IAM 15109 / NBRC 103401 / IFAM 1448) TaxID=756272 RepID=F0ST67_RUBBR|nr:SgcJ/EcaC family oxidoreductase [Rubinisphaera brasiliensis]ADY59278.1 hypothetical protein Plabr_1667 [Rubinisphaera brasiliensis DSM 5305]
MHLLRGALPVLLSCLFCASSLADDNTASPEEQVRSHISRYVQAFNNEDLDGLTSLWAEEGVLTNLTTGESTNGRTQIVAAVKDFLTEQPQAHLSGTVSQVKLLGQDVARVNGHTELTLEDGSVETSSFIGLMLRQGDGWVIESITETSVPLQSAHDALTSLEWLVGTWRDVSDEVNVTTTCNWSRGEAFLLRKFLIEMDSSVVEGTEIIGWDPQFRQIRSWSFFSDGTFGSGFWTENGNKWVIQSVHTLTDGSTEENLRVISDITESSMQVQVTSQSLNGDLQPGRAPVRVERVQSNDAEAAAGDAAAEPEDNAEGDN